MMCDIFFDHLRKDIAGADNKIPARPKMLSPVAFFEFGEFHLETAGRFAFEVFDECADRKAGIDGNEEVDVIGRDRTGENFDIVFVANTADEVARADADLAVENFVAIFCDPRDVELDVEKCVR